MSPESDSELADRAMAVYHYATSACTPDDCPGVQACCHAEHLDRKGFAEVVKDQQELAKAVRRVTELWASWVVPNSAPDQVRFQMTNWPELYAALAVLVDADDGDARRAEAALRPPARI